MYREKIGRMIISRFLHARRDQSSSQLYFSFFSPSSSTAKRPLGMRGFEALAIGRHGCAQRHLCVRRARRRRRLGRSAAHIPARRVRRRPRAVCSRRVPPRLRNSRKLHFRWQHIANFYLSKKGYVFQSRKCIKLQKHTR